MAIVRLEQVQRESGDFVILDHVDAAISAGDRIGLVGPNGAGKTTLLRLVAGIDEPDGGTVHRKRALTIAMLSQEAHVDAAFIGSPSLRRAVRSGASSCGAAGSRHFLRGGVARRAIGGKSCGVGFLGRRSAHHALAGKLGPAAASGPASCRGAASCGGACSCGGDRRRRFDGRTLTSPAEMSCAAADHDPLNRAAAAQARFAGALVDRQMLLHRPVTLRRRVVVDRTSAPLHGLSEDVA